MSDRLSDLPVGTVHDHGCRCWPHVSKSDFDAVALAEYRDGKRAVAEAEATERARIRAAVEGLLSFSIRVDRALTPFDGPDYSGRYAMPPGEVVITALPGQDGLVDRAAVLAAIDREGEA